MQDHGPSHVYINGITSLPDGARVMGVKLSEKILPIIAP